MALGGRVTDEPDDGFTLIELMIVMVVLGILAGIVILKVGTVREDAIRSSCASDIRTLATANLAYAASHDGENAPTIQALIDGDYIKSAPQSGVTFANGETNPASAAGCTGELAFTPDPTTSTSTTTTSTSTTTTSTTTTSTTTPPPAGMRVASIDADKADLGGSNWTTTLTVLVKDENDAVVSGATVTGSWDDGSTPASCDTGADGTCAFISGHSTALPSDTVTWTLLSIDKIGATMAASSTATVTCKRAGGSPCVVQVTI